ncbi:MAG: PilZ domain-containing protein [Spirochaetales bacterium]|jgi:hypothetical protein|nr:PilZ domain-containing protein [Spirochaetales bacterium]
MAEQMEAKFSGKRVFFVYPHSVFQENLIQNLVDLEYEIYILNNHKYVPAILAKYQDAVVFFNIDKGLNKMEWEQFIRDLLSNKVGEPYSLGILSYEFHRDLAQLYLFDLALPCGYIQLKQSLEQATKIMTKTLEANEVKRRRKYVRYKVEEDIHLPFNARIEGVIRNGKILDISSAGLALVFDAEELNIPKNLLLTDIQLNLVGKRILVSGVILGHREVPEQGKTVYVLVFDARVSGDTKGVIRKYVNKMLQGIMEKEFSFS